MIKLTEEQRAAIKADAEQNAVGAGVGDTLRLLADYDALAAELAAIRAAGGELEPCTDDNHHERYRAGWNAAVAQHRRIVAAMAAERECLAHLVRFLAKLYCEFDELRYSTAKLPPDQIADHLLFRWPVLQGTRNQIDVKRISEQPYDGDALHSAIAIMRGERAPALPPLAGQVRKRDASRAAIEKLRAMSHDELLAEVEALLATPSMEVKHDA